MLVGKRTRGSSLLIVLTTVGFQELALSAAIAVFFLGKEARNSGALEVKPVAENHLGKQMIRRACHAHTHAEINFPFGREVQVDRRKNLLLLLADGVEARYRTQRAIIFDSSSNFLGEVIAEFEIRREHQPLIYARAMERSVKRGIEGQIPLAELLRSEEHTSELQSRFDLVCRLLLEKKKSTQTSSLPVISRASPTAITGLYFASSTS